MARFYYFHCTSDEEVLLDRRGNELDDWVEARARAVAVAKSVMTAATGLDDWRDWLVHVSDEQGDEIFVVPFPFVLGRPN